MCFWLLALVQYFVGIKDPTGFTASLVPPHVLTKVFIPDHMTVHCPPVPQALVGQSSCWGGREESSNSVYLADVRVLLNVNKSVLH